MSTATSAIYYSSKLSLIVLCPWKPVVLYILVDENKKCILAVNV